MFGTLLCLDMLLVSGVNCKCLLEDILFLYVLFCCSFWSILCRLLVFADVWDVCFPSQQTPSGDSQCFRTERGKKSVSTCQHCVERRQL